MRRSITNKVMCVVVAALFLFNDICFGLGTMPASIQPDKQGEILRAAGGKLFAKNGPGSINFDEYKPGTFIGKEPKIPGIKFIKADYSKPPAGWKKNPMLQKTDLIEALKYFRDYEAKIPADLLDIREGYFEVDEEGGELPIAVIEKVKDKKNIRYVLIVHTKFVQMWNHIRQNDLWFEGNTSKGMRTVSVAWGIFYHLAKHEMADFTNGGFEMKGGGHIYLGPAWGGNIARTLIVDDDENNANMIGGRYSTINDTIWMWFLGSYCFADSTRYNNELFSDRMRWFFNTDVTTDSTKNLDLEFPSLRKFSDFFLRRQAFKLAQAINYHFFSRKGATVPEFKVDAIFIKEYVERKPSIASAIYATGAPNQGFTPAAGLIQDIQIYSNLDLASLQECARGFGLTEIGTDKDMIITRLIEQKHRLRRGIRMLVRDDRGREVTVIYRGIRHVSISVSPVSDPGLIAKAPGLVAYKILAEERTRHVGRAPADLPVNIATPAAPAILSPEAIVAYRQRLEGLEKLDNELSYSTSLLREALEYLGKGDITKALGKIVFAAEALNEIFPPLKIDLTESKILYEKSRQGQVTEQKAAAQWVAAYKKLKEATALLSKEKETSAGKPLVVSFGEAISGAKNACFIDHIRCPLKYGFHVRLSKKLLTILTEIYLETGAIVFIGNGSRRYAGGIDLLHRVLPLSERAYSSLTKEESHLINKIIQESDRTGKVPDREKLIGLFLSNFGLESSIFTLGIIRGAPYSITVEGDHPKEVLEEIARFVASCSMNELLLEPAAQENNPEGAIEAEREYEEGLDRIANKIEGVSNISTQTPAPEPDDIELSPKELRGGPWNQFIYYIDAAGNVSVEPGQLPSQEEKSLPGQAKRGEEYAFDLRLGAQSDKTAMGRLSGLQSRLRAIVPDGVKLYLPSLESLHIALAGRYPEKNSGLLPDELITRTIAGVSAHLNQSGLNRFTILISGMRVTKNGAIVLDLYDNPILGKLRGDIFDAMRSAGWNEGEVRVNRTSEGKVSAGGIVTLGRIVPTLLGDNVFMTKDERQRLNEEILKINAELNNNPIAIDFDTISFVHPTREFLSEGWDKEIKISISGLAASQAPAKVKVLFADDPANPETLDAIRQKLFESFGSDVGLVEDHGAGKDEGWLRKRIETDKPQVIVVRSATGSFKDPNSSIFQFAKEHGVKAIIRAGAGFDNIAVDKAREYGISVARTHGNANSVADLTLFLLASLDIKMPNEKESKFFPTSDIGKIVQTPADEYLRLISSSKKWANFSSEQKEKVINRWKLEIFDHLAKDEMASLSRLLNGRTIGLLGFGPIAQAVARKLKLVSELTGISLTVIAYSRNLTSDNAIAKELNVTPVSRTELFERSDIVSIHILGIPDLAVRPEELSSPKLKAVINTSRSQLADPQLIQQFVKDRNRTYLADLDMTDDLQKLIEDNPENVVVFPHIGSSTKDAGSGVETRTVSALVEIAEILLGRENSSKEPGVEIVNGIKPQAMAANQASAETHPFIQIISEYIIRIGLDEGPGAERLSATELENIYKTINLLHESRLEIFVPQSVKLTENMKKALKDSGKREGREVIECREYADEKHLAELLKQEQQPGVKRMVLSEDKARGKILGIISASPELFKTSRFLSISLPEIYQDMETGEKTVQQAKFMTIAILARLFEKDKTPMVEALLQDMLKECFDRSTLEIFMGEMGVSDEDAAKLDATAFILRITRLLGASIKLVEKMGREIQLMKNFWIAA